VSAPDDVKERDLVTRTQRIWAIRIGLFIVILAVIVIATSH
jgi:hypothetical protein